MPVDVKIPSVGESITEGTLSRWFKKDGEQVRVDEPLFELETMKATAPIPAPASGTLHITVAEGETVAIGAVVATLVADEPAQLSAPPRTFATALVLPFAELWQRLGARGFALLIGFAALYRFGDYFAQALIIAFFHDGARFDFTTIGLVNKGVGFVGMAVGGLFAGSLVARFGVRRMLVVFGVLAAITNLLYSWLALTGHNLPVFCLAVAVDNISYAFGTTAFLAVLMGVTSPAVSATQFALLSSLSSVGQRLFGLLADDVVRAVDWSGFFAVTAAMALPGLVLAWLVARRGPDV